ncbi:MAG: hypothetical protein LH609_10340 [Rudanella sp.]|nr:hypothetical protein [Rudanella sp.]
MTIVNRHYPPNPGITGESAWDLARYLIEQHGLEVVVVHIDRTYDGGGAVRQPVGETHAVKTIYEGKNGLIRLMAGLLDGFFLIRKAIKVRKGPLVIMTSPPMLPFWASLLLRKTPYWLWSMDLFPEGFAAEGKVNPTNPFYRWVIRQTYRNAPERLIALGPRQATHVLAKYGRDIPTTILPCGVLMHQECDPNHPAWHTKDDGLIYLGYAGNIGQAHSAEFLKSVIKNLDPSRFRLVLALYGTKADEVWTVANGCEGVIRLPNIPRSQLHYLDVQLVSLLPEWTHIAVPSKAMSAIGSGSPILFCGDPDSDSYVLLQEAAFLIDANHNINNQMVDFYETITQKTVAEYKAKAGQVALNLQRMVGQAYDEIAKKSV